MAKRSRLLAKEAGSFRPKPASSGRKEPALPEEAGLRRLSRLPSGQKAGLRRLTPACILAEPAYAGLRRLTPAQQGRSRLTPAYAGSFRGAQRSRRKPAKAGFFWLKSRLLSGQKKPAFGQKAGFFRGAQRRSRLWPESRLLFWPKAGFFLAGKAGSFLAWKEPASAGSALSFGRHGKEPAKPATVRHLLRRQAPHSAPERCCSEGSSGSPRTVLRKTLLWRPKETTEPAKAGFSRVFRVGKSRLLPALAKPALSGQKRLIFREGAGLHALPAGSGTFMSFLDGKRPFLTGFRETLSVLFGVRNPVLGDRILSCSGTPFGPVRARSALFPLYFWPEPAKTGSKSDGNRAGFEPFCHSLARKTTFGTPFGHLLSIQAAPLVPAEEECNDTFRHL